MPGLIGRKIGMTSIFNEEGKNLPCTIIEAGPCVVTQIRTNEADGYEAIQLGYDEKKEKHTPKAMQGHFKKAKTSPKRKLVEFDGFDEEVKLGDIVDVSLFEAGQYVDVTGTTKGKGFQGVVKRHGFHGVGDATHGQHNRMRAPGAIGMSSDPSRVFKGMRMAGQTGAKQNTALNLEVLKVRKSANQLVIKGSVPGANGSFVIVKK